MAESTLVPLPLRPLVVNSLKFPPRTIRLLQSEGRGFCRGFVTLQLVAWSLPDKSSAHKAFSVEAVVIAAAARRPSTFHGCISRCRRFQSWARETSSLPSSTRGSECEQPTVAVGASPPFSRASRTDRPFLTTVISLLKGMFRSRSPIRRLSPSWSSVPPFNRSLAHRWNRYLELPYRTSPARGCSRIRRLTYLFEFQPEGVRLLSVPSFLAKNASLSSSPEGNLRQSMSRMSSVAEDELVALPGPLRAT